MDGYTAAKTIRDFERSQNAPYVPIIALTAHAMVEDRGNLKFNLKTWKIIKNSSWKKLKKIQVEKRFKLKF